MEALLLLLLCTVLIVCGVVFGIWMAIVAFLHFFATVGTYSDKPGYWKFFVKTTKELFKR